MYTCIIWSNSSHAREYEVTTKSAYNAAQKLGRCEGGEVVEIRAVKSNRLLSRVRWSPENGGKYYRSPAWEIDAINTQELREAAYYSKGGANHDY